MSDLQSAVQLWIPSWPEDQFESFKSAVVEIVYFRCLWQQWQCPADYVYM